MEVVVLVEDDDIVQNLQKILTIMLADNRQAWELQPDGSYIQRYLNKNEPERSYQNIFIEMMQQFSSK